MLNVVLVPYQYRCGSGTDENKVAHTSSLQVSEDDKFEHCSNCMNIFIDISNFPFLVSDFAVLPTISIEEYILVVLQYILSNEIKILI